MRGQGHAREGAALPSAAQLPSALPQGSRTTVDAAPLQSLSEDVAAGLDAFQA